MAVTRPALALLAVLGLCSCGDERGLLPPGRPVSGATIALAPSEERLYLTSPDDDRVMAVEASSLEVVDWADVPGQPEQLLLLADRLVVSLTQGTGVATVTIDPDGSLTDVAVVTLPCGGTAGLAAEIQDAEEIVTSVFVTCPHDDRVVEVDPRTGAVRHLWAVPGRPTSVAVRPGELWVTAARTGRVEVLSRAGLSDPAGLDDWDTARPVAPAAIRNIILEPSPGFAASQAGALFADGVTGAVFGTFQRVDRDSDRDRPPEAGGYGAVIDDEPRIEPRLIGPCGPRYAVFDGGVRAMSGPSAVAYSSVGQTLWVVHQYTDTVAVLACDARHAGEPPVLGVSEGRLPLVAAYRIGRGPRGLALTRDGRTAFVDVGFDHAVARLDLAEVGAPGESDDYAAPTLERRRSVGAMRLSPQARRGRGIFHDGVDIHLTPSGVVTCATCHPAGGDDGLTWFLHAPGGIGPKLRRTPAAWNADEESAPFHWDGEFADVGELTHGTIVGLLEGDGLLVDTQAVAAYLDELEPPPGRPRSTARQQEWARGRALFESDAVGCADCHAGDRYTDNVSHRVLSPSADRAARLDQAVTPSLRGVRGRAPFFHDGRAETLADALTTANPDDAHGRTRDLPQTDLDALLLFLESL